MILNLSCHQVIAVYYVYYEDLAFVIWSLNFTVLTVQNYLLQVVTRFPLLSYLYHNKSYCLFFSGGVGFDINCGVRLLRTNLFENDVLPVKEQLAQSLFDHIPVGVGSKGM